MQSVIFTKKVTKGSSGFIVWIGNDLATHLHLRKGTFVEATIKNLTSIKNKQLLSSATFVKKIGQTGKNLHVWISKDVSEFLQLTKNSLIEVNLLVIDRQYGK